MNSSVFVFVYLAFTSAARLSMAGSTTHDMSSHFTAVPLNNSDMEQVSRDKKTHKLIPTGSRAGGDLPLQFSAAGPNIVNAASGSYFCRLMVKEATGRAFGLISNFIQVAQKSEAVVNLSLRSTFRDVAVSIPSIRFEMEGNRGLRRTQGQRDRYELGEVADQADLVTIAIDLKAAIIKIVVGGLAEKTEAMSPLLKTKNLFAQI